MANIVEGSTGNSTPNNSENNWDISRSIQWDEEDINWKRDVTYAYDPINKKIQDMIAARDGDLDTEALGQILLPSLDEMIEEDLMTDVLISNADEYYKGTNKESGTTPVEKAAYFTENPPIMTPGYYEDQGVFILRHANLKSTPYRIPELDKLTNAFDGDTYTFLAKDLDVGGSFTKDGKTYKDFNAYCQSYGGKLLSGYNFGKITTRSIGMDCPEIPHYSILPYNPKTEITVTKTINEINEGLSRNETYNYLKSKYTRKENVYSDAVERNKDEKIKFLQIKDGTKVVYKEILKESGWTGGQLEELKERFKGTDNDTKFALIVSGDESNTKTLDGAYRAADLAKSILESAEEIILMVNAQTMNAPYRVTNDKLTIANWWYASDIINHIEKMWPRTIDDIGKTRMAYAPSGCDIYGRFLSTVYVRKAGTEKFVNLNKMILANNDENFSIGNKSFTSSAALRDLYGAVPDIFRTWSYQQDNYKWMDQFEQSAGQNYKEFIDFHKEVTGVDFNNVRQCYTMIGDTMMLIPPTAIRNISQHTYERVPVLRGTGTMQKDKGNREHMIELQLYFYGDKGINGIPKTVKTPSGKQLTYHMNGLRALLAQFKIAPFLPIQNEHINDVLGIEAVTLMGIQVTTVEGYPQLLQASLTLREFKYRVYMPDLPLDDDEDAEDVTTITQMNPVFAKCFNWPVFRYYYQRLLHRGDKLRSIITKEDGFVSEEYGEIIYSKNHNIQPVGFCNSTVTFYTPDETWLSKALQIKKERDQSRMDLVATDVSENAVKFMKNFIHLGDVFSYIEHETPDRIHKEYSDVSRIRKAVESHKSLVATAFKTQNNEYDIYVKGSSKIPNVLTVSNTNLEYRTKNKNDAVSDVIILEKYIRPCLQPIVDELLMNPIVRDVKVSEEVVNDDLIFTFLCYIPGTNLSTNEKTSIKELFAQYTKTSAGEILGNGSLSFKLRLPVDLSKKVVVDSSNPRDTLKAEESPDKTMCTSILSVIDPETNTIKNSMQSDNEFTAEEIQNYMNPKHMRFVPYVKDVLCSNVTLSTSNSFTDISLKAVDSHAPQYLGGQDTQAEIVLVTSDQVVIAMINKLPALAVETTKEYRKIMPCWPLKIKNVYLQLFGMNECLIDSIDIANIDGAPGTYEITLRVTSVDRSQRQREALRKIDEVISDSLDTSNSAMTQSVNSFFGINNYLSTVELYPDLDLPTLDELAQDGYLFIKYAGTGRVYPDPDFYIGYSYPYTAKVIKDTLAKKYVELLESDDTELGLFEMQDRLGFKTKVELTGSKGLEFNDKHNNEALNVYDALVTRMSNELARSNSLKGAKAAIPEMSKARIRAIADLKVLTLQNITKGWTIKQGWKAPLTDVTTNAALLNLGKKIEIEGKEVEYTNVYADEIFKLRQSAITAINDILYKPLKNKSVNSISSNNTYTKNIPIGVSMLFNNPEYKKLYNLLYPITKGAELYFKYMTQHSKGEEKAWNDGNWLQELLDWRHDENNKVNWDVALDNKYSLSTNSNTAGAEKIDITSIDTYINPVFMRYLMGYTYAAACTRTGDTKYIENNTKLSWFNNSKPPWHPRQIMLDNEGKDITFKDGSRKLNAFTDNVTGNPTNFKSNKEAMDQAYSLSMFGIAKYSIAEIRKMMEPKASFITYHEIGKGQEMYRDKDGKESYRTGFIDPYYNFAGPNSKEGKEYYKAIATNGDAAVEAFIRNVLQWLKKMILDGLFFGEIDIIMQDMDKLLGTVNKEMTIKKEAFTPSKYGKYAEITRKVKLEREGKTEEEKRDEEKNKEQTDEEIKTIRETMQTYLLEYARAFCSRMIYPFMLAASSDPEKMYQMLLDRDYSTLDTMINTIASRSSESNTSEDKFLSACYGLNMIVKSKNKNDIKVNAAQRSINGLINDVYLKAGNDPKQYIKHSFYDMLRHDKRGRLVRAFPAYYVMFMDEGRRIGTWKLFDNFYNMSSIASIDVIKSRKMAADTCNIVMSNTYMSYAQQHSTATYQNYANVYGLRDTFDSIFSPQKYFTKEEALRSRLRTPDTVVFEPGVRLHVRMGYGADASRLPTVFNGKIAEIGVEDIVNISASSDGAELLNPLTAFGDVETRNLKEHQDLITLGADIRGNFSRGGETPRNMLANILTAKHGGIKKYINEQFDGRWFNDNPFGITHFGDWRYKEHFDEGEMVQNLYEVMDNALLRGANDFYSDINVKNMTPVLNTTLQDKNMWDMMHLAANSGIDYVTGVRPFGMRSTIFLGKPQYYYAYDYAKWEGTIVEKRKPFQQFHYYDSYTDIIYNTVKATEKDMKTNAVGIWQQTGKLWGKEQAQVEPIYLDMNIYPEYQKSMTVNTGLLAAGNGGLKAPILGHYAEKWAFDANDDKVNKATAWRVTMNTLRNSVKDMYTGELCVIGDPSVNPNDRMAIFDTYADMQGQSEVETVIHSMNIETGFTTTIVPDLIVRHYAVGESTTGMLITQAMTMLASSCALRLGLIHRFANAESVIAKQIAKAGRAPVGLRKGVNAIGDIMKGTKMGEFVGNRPAMQKLISNVLSTPGFTGKELKVAQIYAALQLEGFKAIDPKMTKVYIGNVDGFLESKRLSTDSADDIAKQLKKYDNALNQFDGDAFKNNVGGIMDELFDVSNPNDMHLLSAKEREALLNFKSTSTAIDDIMQKSVKEVHEMCNFVKNQAEPLQTKLKAVYEAAKKLDDPKDLKVIMKFAEQLESIKGIKLDSSKNYRKVLSFLQDFVTDKDGYKVLSNLKVTEVGEVSKFLDDIILRVNKMPANSPKLGALIKNINSMDDVLKIFGRVFNFKNVLGLSSLVFMIVQTALEIIVVNNVREMTTRWMKNVNALIVYPMKYNNGMLLAGMNGHAGSVYGAPPADKFNTIQGMLMQGIKYLDESMGWFSEWLMSAFILDRTAYEEIQAQWKLNLGITDEKDMRSEAVYQQVYDAVGNELSSKNMAAKAIVTKRRIKSYATKSDPLAKAAYQKARITNVKTAAALGTNEKVKGLFLIEADPEIKKIMSAPANSVTPLFAISHNQVNTTSYQIAFENGTYNVPVMPVASNSAVVNDSGSGDKYIYDVPALREEGLSIIKLILQSNYIIGTATKGTIYLKSATRVNDSLTWKNTGYAFSLESKNADALEKAIKDVREFLKYGKQHTFAYVRKGDIFNITVYAPVAAEKE